MPKTIDGKPLTKREHKQFKAVMEKTGSGAIATSAVQKSRKKK